MLNDLLIGFALLLVVEGLMPFLSPRGWKQMMANIMQMPESTIRIVGLISMLAGVGLLYWVKG